MDQEYHQMVLEEVHPSGEETWNCPICGRRFQVTWEPKFRKTVLEIGDTYVTHSGGKSGMQMGSVQHRYKRRSEIEENSISIGDSTLAPWEEWLDKVGFENLWNKDN